MLQLKKTVITISIALLLVIAAAAFGYLDLIRYGHRPVGNGAGRRLVTVEPGVGFSVVTDRLAKAGFVRLPWRFKLLARLKGYDKRIKAGEYFLSALQSPIEILETMVAGKVYLRKLTVPEGFNLEQIAALVDSRQFASGKDFIAAAHDARLLQELKLDADSFEGYLFPDTYFFPGSITVRQIIATMFRRFRQVIRPEWLDRAGELSLSVHQVVTLASMIEKETGDPRERPIISSVFHNRLKKRMRLASDPTVIYGIDDFDGNLTRRHLKDPHPYNTYQHKGLPPGPIANPGAASIEAALYPADTLYLYFVSKKDRTHQFSANIRDHNRAVRKYQLRRRK